MTLPIGMTFPWGLTMTLYLCVHDRVAPGVTHLQPYSGLEKYLILSPETYEQTKTRIRDRILVSLQHISKRVTNG
jgi:hypothetical protein